MFSEKNTQILRNSLEKKKLQIEFILNAHVAKTKAKSSQF